MQDADGSGCNTTCPDINCCSSTTVQKGDKVRLYDRVTLFCNNAPVVQPDGAQPELKLKSLVSENARKRKFSFSTSSALRPRQRFEFTGSSSACPAIRFKKCDVARIRTMKWINEVRVPWVAQNLAPWQYTLIKRQDLMGGTVIKYDGLRARFRILVPLTDIFLQ